MKLSKILKVITKFIVKNSEWFGLGFAIIAIYFALKAKGVIK